MIGRKALTGALLGLLLTSGAALADTTPDRDACSRGVSRSVSSTMEAACGPAMRGSHRRVLRPVLGGIHGYPTVSLLRNAPVRFTSLLILGVGY